MTADTVTVTIEADDESDELTVPTALVDLLREGEETTPQVIGDVALMSLAQHVHATVHHGHGHGNDEIGAVEEQTMELFEERFGQTFGDVTGHQH